MTSGGAQSFELAVLGRFELRSGDETLIDRQWPRRKASALLKILALEPSHALHRDRVLDALWPELSADAAANSLYKSMHYLKGVADGAAVLRANVLALSPGVSVDLDAFATCARNALDSGDAGMCDEALALCPGQLLPDDVYEEWTHRPRAEVEALRVRLLSLASVRAVASGRLDVARDRLEQIVALDRTNEDAHRGLMRILHQSGETQLAQQQYERCRDALRADLDVEPAPATEKLYQTIVEAQRGEPPLMRFATAADGARIAHYTIGEGPPLVVMPASPLSHVRREWDVPAIRGRMERLARGRLVVAYDPRNAGLSDRKLEVSLSSQVRDLTAVVDALGLESFALLAEGQSAPAAITFALANKQRVTHLVLYAAFARGTDYLSSTEVQSSLAMMPHDWRHYCDVYAAMYTGWDQPATATAWAQVMAESTRVEFVEAAMRALAEADVAPILSRVRTPALVLRRRDAPIFGEPMSRELYTGLPCARYVPLDGRAIASFAGDVDALVSAINEFLDEPAPR